MTPHKPSLIVGRAYFECAYYLRRLPVPEIETWIYIGQNLKDEDKDADGIVHYFEHPDVYFAEEIEVENQKDKNPMSMNSACSTPEYPRRRMAIADEDLEGLIYDYEDLVAFVTALRNDENSELAF